MATVHAVKIADRQGAGGGHARMVITAKDLHGRELSACMPPSPLKGCLTVFENDREERHEMDF
jgi:hypothetical protein